MSTTSSVNAGLSTLLQDLTNIGSPLASSPTVVSALEKASPADIVQLSTEAIQLQGLDAMFGVPDSAAGSGVPADPLLAAVYGQEGGLAPATTDSGASSTINPALSTISQALSSAGLPAQDLSALQNASPTDLVQLSSEATQLAGLNGLFA